MLSSQALAETSPHYGKRLTTGVLNRYYYIDSYAASWFGSYPYPKATTSHEFGHAMGLAHQNSTPSSIMAQAKYRDKSVTRAHYMDLYHINQLY